MQKIGFSLQNSDCRPMEEVLRLLHDIGFGAVSPVWTRAGDWAAAADTAVRLGLTLQSLHGPLRGIPDLWCSDSDRAAPLLRDVLDALDACADHQIPLLVVHTWTGLDYRFRADGLYFGNFDILVDRAQHRGVQIAFENLEGPEYLDALMARYRDCPAVGFCWDSGHERCYTPQRDFLADFGDRLLMTHLNDNLGVTDPGGRLQGTDDLHLLPGDGTLCWPQAVRRLAGARRQEILNFELKIRPKGDRCTLDLYSSRPLAQYLTDAYQRACTVAEAYEAALRERKSETA